MDEGNQMVERCETCGKVVVPEPKAATYHVITTEGELVTLLKQMERRMVYRFKDRHNEWGLTHGHGLRVAPALVRSAVKAGILHSCYSNCPDDAYWLGSTIDVDATLERRRQTGNKQL